MNRVILFAFVVLPLMAAPTDCLASGAEFPTKFPWGRLVATQETVELHVDAVSPDRVIAIPRFNNSYKRIYVRSDKQRRSLKFWPDVDKWLITMPTDAGDAGVIVIETVGEPRLLARPFVNTADERGTITLPAHHAIVHGEKLRFEPQPHKNTVGFWHNEKDWCEWKLNVSKPGKYVVRILQGCGKGHGGSLVEIKAGSSRLTFTVEDTGHFQKFKDRDVGTVQITRSGEQSLEVRPIRKAKTAVMDVRSIRLIQEP